MTLILGTFLGIIAVSFLAYLIFGGCNELADSAFTAPNGNRTRQALWHAYIMLVDIGTQTGQRDVCVFPRLNGNEASISTFEVTQIPKSRPKPANDVLLYLSFCYYGTNDYLPSGAGLDESDCAVGTIALSAVFSLVGFFLILILMGVVVDYTRNTLDRSVFVRIVCYIGVFIFCLVGWLFGGLAALGDCHVRSVDSRLCKFIW